MVRLLYRGAVGLLLALAAKPQTPEPAGLIRVEVTGLRNDKGQVVCALFSSPGDFPKKTDKAVAQANSGISQGQSTCEFERVAPARMPSRFFTMRILMASWTPSSWGCLEKA